MDIEMDLCRACRSSEGPMINIFCISLENGVSLAEVFARTSGLPVSIEDSFPHTICTRCLPAMIDAYDIQMLVEKNAHPEWEGRKPESS